MANATSALDLQLGIYHSERRHRGFFSRLDFLIKKLITSKTERCFVNFHVWFSCGSSGGQWASTMCRIVSVEGIHDLEPIQNMMIYRTKPPAWPVLIARPGQSYQSEREEIKGKDTSQVPPARSEACQPCTSMTGLTLVICSLARSYFWYSVSSGPFQWNWVYGIFVPSLASTDEARKKNPHFTWKRRWGLVTLHPAITGALEGGHETLHST